VATSGGAARALGYDSHPKPRELVVVSPLLLTLQTAVGVWGGESNGGKCVGSGWTRCGKVNDMHCARSCRVTVYIP
jgi:hypothetical protein